MIDTAEEKGLQRGASVCSPSPGINEDKLFIMQIALSCYAMVGGCRQLRHLFHPPTFFSFCYTHSMVL